MKKNNEEKINENINSDINGRIEYIDQGLRSVDNRMRAVEKRLSIKVLNLKLIYHHMKKREVLIISGNMKSQEN